MTQHILYPAEDPTLLTDRQWIAEDWTVQKSALLSYGSWVDVVSFLEGSVAWRVANAIADSFDIPVRIVYDRDGVTIAYESQEIRL